LWTARVSPPCFNCRRITSSSSSDTLAIGRAATDATEAVAGVAALAVRR
jgi:hypothetical protein